MVSWLAKLKFTLWGLNQNYEWHHYRKLQIHISYPEINYKVRNPTMYASNKLLTIAHVVQTRSCQNVSVYLWLLSPEQ